MRILMNFVLVILAIGFGNLSLAQDMCIPSEGGGCVVNDKVCIPALSSCKAVKHPNGIVKCEAEKCASPSGGNSSPCNKPGEVNCCPNSKIPVCTTNSKFCQEPGICSMGGNGPAAGGSSGAGGGQGFGGTNNNSGQGMVPGSPSNGSGSSGWSRPGGNDGNNGGDLRRRPPGNNGGGNGGVGGGNGGVGGGNGGVGNGNGKSGGCGGDPWGVRRRC